MSPTGAFSCLKDTVFRWGGPTCPPALLSGFSSSSAADKALASVQLFSSCVYLNFSPLCTSHMHNEYSARKTGSIVEQMCRNGNKTIRFPLRCGCGILSDCVGFGGYNWKWLLLLVILSPHSLNLNGTTYKIYLDFNRRRIVITTRNKSNCNLKEVLFCFLTNRFYHVHQIVHIISVWWSV